MLDYRTIQITELPIGSWTVDYKNYLESLMESKEKKKVRKKERNARVIYILYRLNRGEVEKV